MCDCTEDREHGSEYDAMRTRISELEGFERLVLTYREARATRLAISGEIATVVEFMKRSRGRQRAEHAARIKTLEGTLKLAQIRLDDALAELA